MRHVSEAGDDDQRPERVEIPRHEAENLLGQGRENADRPDRNDIAERDDDSRDENRNQQQRFEVLLARHIGAHHQEGEQGAERHGDRGHTAGDRDGGPEGLPEVVVGKDEGIGGKARLGRRIEERCRQEALVEHQRERHRHGERGDAENQEPVHNDRHYCSFGPGRSPKSVILRRSPGLDPREPRRITGLLFTRPSSPSATSTGKRAAWSGRAFPAASGRSALAAPGRR